MDRTAPCPTLRVRGSRGFTTAALAAAGALALSGCGLFGAGVPRIAVQEDAGTRWLTVEELWEQPEGQSSGLLMGPLEVTPEGCVAVGEDTGSEAGTPGSTLVAIPEGALMREGDRVFGVRSGDRVFEVGDTVSITGGFFPADRLSREVRDAVAACGVRDEVVVPGTLE
ncbi:hypothetical protein KZX06_05400 [Micrococcus sp. EYE_162]|nr:hypothetical protein [Micrococcus sp. EYE_212]MCK6171474.1 hypothetical protein [Micrococcus sp. EYE_162]